MAPTKKRRPGPYFVVAQGYHTHPKALAAGKDGRAFHLAALDYTTSNRTDGVLLASVVATVHHMAGTKRAALEAAVSAGLIDRQPDGNYIVHDFPDWQRTAEEIEATGQARAASGRVGGLAKGKQSVSKVLSKTLANGKQTSSKNQAEEESESEVELTHSGERVLTVPRETDTPFGAGEPMYLDREWAGAWRDARLAIGITIPDPNGEAAIDERAQEAVAAGTDHDIILEAIGDCARNTKAVPGRLAEYDIPRVLQRRAEVKRTPIRGAAGQRKTDRDARLEAAGISGGFAGALAVLSGQPPVTVVVEAQA